MYLSVMFPEQWLVGQQVILAHEKNIRMPFTRYSKGDEPARNPLRYNQDFGEAGPLLLKMRNRISRTALMCNKNREGHLGRSVSCLDAPPLVAPTPKRELNSRST